MYFPYVRGRQFELIALRELVENDRIHDRIIPIIEPIKPSSTLLKTLEAFIKKERKIAIVYNPVVGDFTEKLNELKNENSRLAQNLEMLLMNNAYIIQAYIINDRIAMDIKENDEKDKYMIVSLNRDSLDDYLTAYENIFPKFSLIPNDRAFKRVVSENKVILEDYFNKQPRNTDYLNNDDEFFSDIHLYYQDENYVGFSDYTIVGEEFNESGFAPIAVAIHIVYLDKKNNLRIHHFVSDSNEGIEDPAGKFGEALEKLVKWCKKNNVYETMGLRGFYDCYSSQKYPGLGTVKKYSIMHHIELVNAFLEGNL